MSTLRTSSKPTFLPACTASLYVRISCARAQLSAAAAAAARLRAVRAEACTSGTSSGLRAHRAAAGCRHAVMILTFASVGRAAVLTGVCASAREACCLKAHLASYGAVRLQLTSSTHGSSSGRCVLTCSASPVQRPPTLGKFFCTARSNQTGRQRIIEGQALQGRQGRAGRPLP